MHTVFMTVIAFILPVDRNWCPVRLCPSTRRATRINANPKVNSPNK